MKYRPGEMAFFSKQMGKERIKVGLIKYVMHLTKCLVDTGAGQNLVNNDPRQQWRKRTQQLPTPKLPTEMKQAMYLSLDSILWLFRWEGYKSVHGFSWLKKMAIEVLIGTTFTDRCIRGIFPMERRIVPLHSWSAAILSAAQRSQESIIILSTITPVNKDITTAVSRVAKTMTLPAETEAPLMMTTSRCGLMEIEKSTIQKNMNRLLPARCIDNVWPHRAFPILVTNFSRKPVMLHKNTIIAVGIEPPSTVVTSRIDDEKEAKRMDEKEETGQQGGKPMTIHD